MVRPTKQSQQKLKVTQPKTPSFSGVQAPQSSGTGKTFNPQQAKAVLQAEPKKREYNKIQYDALTRTFKSVKTFDVLNEADWRLKQIEIEAQQRIAQDFANIISSYGNSKEARQVMAQYVKNRQANIIVANTETLKEYDRLSAELNQLRNDANYYHVQEEIEEQLELLEQERQQYITHVSNISQSLADNKEYWDSQPITKGVPAQVYEWLEPGLDFVTDIGKGKWNVGNVTTTVFEMAEFLKRGAMTGAYLLNSGDRIVQDGTTGERTELLDELTNVYNPQNPFETLQAVWNATENKNPFMTAEQLETGRYGIMDLVNQSVADRVNGYITALNTALGTTTQPIKRDDPAFQAVTAFLVNEIIADPATYLGANSMRAIKKSLKLKAGITGAKSDVIAEGLMNTLKKVDNNLVKSGYLGQSLSDGLKWTKKVFDDAPPATRKAQRIWKQKKIDDKYRPFAQKASKSLNQSYQRLQEAKYGVNKLRRELRNDFGRVVWSNLNNEQELQAWTKWYKAGSPLDKVPKEFRSNARGWSRLDVAIRENAQNLRKLERQAGIKYDTSENYLPAVKGLAGDTKKVPDPDEKPPVWDNDEAGFATRRLDKKYQKRLPQTLEELADTLTARQLDSLRARRAGVYKELLDEIDKIDNIKSVRALQTGAWRRELDKLDEAYEGKRLLTFNDKLALTYTSDGLWSQVNKPVVLAGMLWRQAVLVARPAWYINNEAFNIASAISTGGIKSLYYRIGARRRLKELDVTLKQLEDVNAGVDAFYLLGQSKWQPGRLASRQEQNARQGFYLAMRDQMDHAEAIQELNKALNMYGDLKNWERPFRAFIPFWQWQKFIVQRTATLPIDSPRASKGWAMIYEKFYEEPLEKLPNEERQWTDEQGKVFTWNPRDQYEGKMKIPFTNTWISTPFNAMTPEALNQIGITPLINAWNEYVTGKDRFGYNIADKEWWEIIGRQFPQFTLAKALIDSNRTSGGILADQFGEIKNKKQWLALGSALPKELQGFDPNAPNYDKNLDARHEAGERLASYFGIPRQKQWDINDYNDRKAEFDYKQDFFKEDWTRDNKKWWSVQETWDPKLEKMVKKNRYDWQKMRSYQEQQAKDHGFNLQKDVFGTSENVGMFNKNDAEYTKTVKADKELADAVQADFWTSYDIEVEAKEDKFDARATKYIQAKRIEWEKNQTFKKNPQLKNLLQDWFFKGTDSNYKKLDLTDPTKYFAYRDWLEGGGVQAEALARYKRSPKGQFWDRYHALKAKDETLASDFFKLNFKESYRATKQTSNDKAKDKFWTEFFDIDDNQKLWEYYTANYKSSYGGKKQPTPHQLREMAFWNKFFYAGDQERKDMLEANPQYNKQAEGTFTQEQWDTLRNERKSRDLKALKKEKGFSEFMNAQNHVNLRKARQAFGRTKPIQVKWKVR